RSIDGISNLAKGRDHSGARYAASRPNRATTAAPAVGDTGRQRENSKMTTTPAKVAMAGTSTATCPHRGRTPVPSITDADAAATPAPAMTDQIPNWPGTASRPAVVRATWVVSDSDPASGSPGRVALTAKVAMPMITPTTPNTAARTVWT